jgi:type I restriction enzyme S subunit
MIKNNITDLRKSILQYAIEGKLVAQDTNDEPASELLKKIRKNETATNKKKQPLKPITDDEKPFDLPKGWEWCRLGEIGMSYSGLIYKPTDISKNGIPVLRSNNIQNNKIDMTDLVRVNKEISVKLKIEINDIIICFNNGSKDLLGKCARVKNLPENMTFGSFMGIFKSEINNFMEIYFNSLFRNFLSNFSKSIGINSIKLKEFENYIVPLPPLSEQNRIVKKLEALEPLLQEYEKLRERERGF